MGESVGASVGDAVGASVGDAVGASVGSCVGLSVGAFVSSVSASSGSGTRQITKPAACFLLFVFHLIRSPCWTTTPSGPLLILYFIPFTVK